MLIGSMKDQLEVRLNAYPFVARQLQFRPFAREKPSEHPPANLSPLAIPMENWFATK